MDDLISSIERALSEIHQLERTVGHYKGASQVLLYDRINDLVAELANIQASADSCQANIPLEVIRFVDDGRNPDAFTRDFLMGCRAQNEATKGKVDAFKSLRRKLAEEVDAAFPEEMEIFRELRTTSMEMTNAAQGPPSNAHANGSSERELKPVKEESQDEGADVDMS